MRFFIALLLSYVLSTAIIPTWTAAQEQTPTGFYYPSGTSELGNYAGWLAEPPDYFDGY